MGNPQNKDRPQKVRMRESIKLFIGKNLKSEITHKTTQKTPLTIQCNQCGSIYENTWQKIKARHKTHTYFTLECQPCARKIGKMHSKNTMIKKYGVDHYMKLDKFKEKVARTNQERYGGKAPAHSDKVKAKMRKTNLKLYGTPNAIGNSKVDAKIRAASLEKYGVEHHTQAPSVVAKKSKTLNTRYGVDNPMKVPEFISKNLKAKGFLQKEDVMPKLIKDLEENPNQIISSKSFMEKHGVYYVTIFRWLRECGREDLIPNKGYTRSSKEDEVLGFIKEHYRGEIQTNIRGMLSNKRLEVDIYLPELKLGVEYHGLYWHSELKVDNDYHFRKREMAEEAGISLIQIYSDEWEHKQDVVKSMILSRLNSSPHKVYARNTFVSKVSAKEASKFTQENHLMGSISGVSTVALMHNQEIVSIMSYKVVKGVVKIERFCSKLNHSVVGGFSKLLKFVQKETEITKVVSFVDLRYANGHSLKRLGFKLKSVTPSFKWTDCQVTYNRLRCRANMDSRGLSEEEHSIESGLVKVFGAGQARFEI